MMEFVEVHASFDDEPNRIVEPRTIWFDTVPEALAAIKRCLKVGCTVIVDTITCKMDEVENDDNPDLDDWPLRHVYKQKRTADGWITEPRNK